jgi:hypothetical protein
LIPDPTFQKVPDGEIRLSGIFKSDFQKFLDPGSEIFRSGFRNIQIRLQKFSDPAFRKFPIRL